MNSFKIAETILNVVPVTMSTLLQNEYPFDTLFSMLSGAQSQRIHKFTQRYGIVAFFPALVNPDAWDLIEGMERVLVGSDKDAIEFKQSVSSTLNMTAMAVRSLHYPPLKTVVCLTIFRKSAFLAQVAITALSLEGIESVHGTAAAFFVASFLSGLFAVYSAFMVLNRLNNLIGVQQLRRWLSLPPKPSNNSADTDDLESSQLPGSKDPSLAAALVISSPTGLLGLALLCLVVGTGVYFASVYINNLRPGWGVGGSRGILVFYSVFTVYGLQKFSFPDIMKSIETIAFQILNQRAAKKGKNNRSSIPVEEQRSREAVQDIGIMHIDISNRHQDSEYAGSSLSEFEKMFQAYLQTQEESQRLGRELLIAYSQMGTPGKQ